MAQGNSGVIKKSISCWWFFLLTGFILAGTGIWMFVWPIETYLSLSIFFAFSILFTGVFEAAYAVLTRKSIDGWGWGWTLASGIMDIFIGIYLVVYPSITMQVLPLILGFWLLFKGFSAIGFALDMKSYEAGNWGVLLALAIIIIFLGCMVLAVPAFGILNIIVWTAFSFVAAGIFRILLALKLRNIIPPTDKNSGTKVTAHSSWN